MSGGFFLYRTHNVIHQGLHQRGIVAFGHHANKRLRAGFADQQATMAGEFLFGVADGFLNGGVIEEGGGGFDVAENLRHGREQGAYVAGLAFLAFDNGQNLQGGD